MAQIKSSEFCRQVKIPVLAPYGGKDLNVLAAKNMTALTAELRAAGNRDFTIKVFPDANHDGFETTDLILDGEQARYLTRLVPGLVKQACFAQKWGIASERNLFIPNTRRWNRGIC